MIPEGTVISGIIGGFISKLINDSVDVSKPTIKKVIESKTTKDVNMQSQIYQVIINALNLMVPDKDKENRDIIYDAAESLLKELKNHKGDSIEAIRVALAVFNEPVNNERCNEFKIILYHEICKNDALYKEVSLINQNLQINGINSVIYGVDEVKQLVTEIKENGTNERDLLNCNAQQTVKSRTQEYADKWNANMFLNDFNRRDENAGINVSLKDVYLEDHLPHYIWGDNKNESNDLKELLTEFVEDNKIKTLLILGQPGIGKSTLITWFIVNCISRKEDILVYHFASDLNKIDWNCSSNIKNYKYWDDILDLLGLTNDTLNGKILIFDGFDEIDVRISTINILNKLLSREVKMMQGNFKVIVTCRENYIHGWSRVKYDFITLLPWDRKQIDSFCMVYGRKIKYNISENMMDIIKKNREVLGIPLILYMVLALNISIEENGSIVDIYDKIFSLKGGIYDRCIENKSFADIHRIGEIKAQIHQISREIAIWMFENNPDRAFIPQLEYQRICIDIKRNSGKEGENIDQDFLIGNYFKLVKHCEGTETEELYFVHRSIYEYFVAETIYSSIKNALITLSEDSQKELAENIAFYLKEGEITNTIGEFLFRKIKNLYDKLNTEKKQEFYQWWESAVGKMMEVGMFYYTKRNIQDYEDIIKKEGTCFLNLLKILRLLLSLTNRRYIMENVNIYKIIDYISLGQWGNYSYLFLEGANLRGKRLHELNLEKSNLQKADLRRADLIGANLCEADLREADLRGAELRSINLKGTLLKGTIFDERQISELEEYYNNLQDASVYIEKAEKTISYKEYRKRKPYN